jgi:hypothetical protein
MQVYGGIGPAANGAFSMDDYREGKISLAEAPPPLG